MKTQKIKIGIDRDLCHKCSKTKWIVDLIRVLYNLFQMDKKARFLQIYANLPLNQRNEIVVVIDDEPLT